MKFLLVSDNIYMDAMGENIKNKILVFLEEQKQDFVHYELEKEEVNQCVGCFNCWLKTPGICVFDDMGREIAKEYIQSDVVIFTTPVKYGCYSVATRRVVDRLLPTILPFFRKVNNEVHHAPRYSKYPEFVVIGYREGLRREEEETLKSLADANALNFVREKSLTYCCKEKDDIEVVIDSLKKHFANMEGIGV